MKKDVYIDWILDKFGNESVLLKDSVEYESVVELFPEFSGGYSVVLPTSYSVVVDVLFKDSLLKNSVLELSLNHVVFGVFFAYDDVNNPLTKILVLSLNGETVISIK